MPLQIKIDCKKLKKEWFFNANSGAAYVDLNVYENDQEDQYGNTHVVKQNPDKASREAGAKAHIVGNGKIWGNDKKPTGSHGVPVRPPAQQRQAARQQAASGGDVDGDDIPFFSPCAQKIAGW